MSADDQLVQVGGLLAGEPVQAQVIQDQQVWARKERSRELSTRVWVMDRKKSSAWRKRTV